MKQLAMTCSLFEDGSSITMGNDLAICCSPSDDYDGRETLKIYYYKPEAFSAFWKIFVDVETVELEQPIELPTLDRPAKVFVFDGRPLGDIEGNGRPEPVWLRVRSVSSNHHNPSMPATMRHWRHGEVGPLECGGVHLLSGMFFRRCAGAALHRTC